MVPHDWHSSCLREPLLLEINGVSYSRFRAEGGENLSRRHLFQALSLTYQIN